MYGVARRAAHEAMVLASTDSMWTERGWWVYMSKLDGCIPRPSTFPLRRYCPRRSLHSHFYSHLERIRIRSNHLDARKHRTQRITVIRVDVESPSSTLRRSPTTETECMRMSLFEGRGTSQFLSKNVRSCSYLDAAEFGLDVPDTTQVLWGTQMAYGTQLERAYLTADCTSGVWWKTTSSRQA